MGKANAAVNEYLADNSRFADLFNTVVFHGEQVISPEELEEMDTKALRTGRQKDTAVHGEYIRDQMKEWKQGAGLLVLGLEPENSVHYALPVKLMKYESIRYEAECRSIRKRHRKERDLSRKEFISGFGRDDRLTPVVTIALYHGKEEWDAPDSLHGMLAFERLPKELRETVKSHCNDYHVNLVDVNNMENSEEFRTDLREVFGFLKRRNDKEELKRYVEENEAFRHLESDTYDVIRVLSNSKDIPLKKEECGEEGGRYDMCKALREWGEEERNKGNTLCLIRLVLKKQEKKKPVAQIAEELEEEEAVINRILRAVERAGSDDLQQIYECLDGE